jgi:hypothetical protein
MDRCEAVSGVSPMSRIDDYNFLDDDDHLPIFNYFWLCFILALISYFTFDNKLFWHYFLILHLTINYFGITFLF